MQSSNTKKDDLKLEKLKNLDKTINERANQLLCGHTPDPQITENLIEDMYLDFKLRHKVKIGEREIIKYPIHIKGHKFLGYIDIDSLTDALLDSLGYSKECKVKYDPEGGRSFVEYVYNGAYFKAKEYRSKDSALTITIIKNELNKWNKKHKEDDEQYEELTFKDITNDEKRNSSDDKTKLFLDGLKNLLNEHRIIGEFEEGWSEISDDPIKKHIEHLDNIRRFTLYYANMYEYFKFESTNINGVNKAREFISFKAIFSYDTIKNMRDSSSVFYDKVADKLRLYVLETIDFDYDSCKNARDFVFGHETLEGVPAYKNGFVEYHIEDSSKDIDCLVIGVLKKDDNGQERFTKFKTNTIGGFLGSENPDYILKKYNNFEMVKKNNAN